MKHLTTLAAVSLIFLLLTQASAQESMHWKIDSTAIVNGHLCYVLNSYFDDVLHETQWVSNENGYVRQYAYITYGMGSDTLDWDEFYFVKQFPQVGDTWQMFADGPKEVEVMSVGPITVPAGTFTAYYLEIREPGTPQVVGDGYCVEGVGRVAGSWQGSTGVLDWFTIEGGFGCFPLDVNNEWEYEPPNGIRPFSECPSVPQFQVLSVCPNPFNPSTVLSFELRVSSLVKLEVFDINGCNVGAKHFPNASPVGFGESDLHWYPAGAHQIPFDGSNLPSGLYFAKLTAGEQTAVQKLVLLK